MTEFYVDYVLNIQDRHNLFSYRSKRQQLRLRMHMGRQSLDQTGHFDRRMNIADPLWTDCMAGTVTKFHRILSIPSPFHL